MTYQERQRAVLQICYDLQQLGRPFDWTYEDVPQEKWPPLRNIAELAEICAELEEKKLISCQIYRQGKQAHAVCNCQIEPRGIRVWMGEEEFPTSASSASFTIIDNSVKISDSISPMVVIGNNNNASIQLSHINESIGELKKLVCKLSASEAGRKDALSALDILESLAKKPKSAEVIAHANAKLELVRNIIGTAVELNLIAAPYIAIIASWFS